LAHSIIQQHYQDSFFQTHPSQIAKDCLHLIVDVTLTDARLSVKGFTSRSFARTDEKIISRYSTLDPENSESAFLTRFIPARISYYTYEAERIGGVVLN
jgi:hypothetical protein